MTDIPDDIMAKARRVADDANMAPTVEDSAITIAAAEARVAVLEKALRVARGCIWFGGDTISALKKIDAALTPIKENDHAE